MLTSDLGPLVPRNLPGGRDVRVLSQRTWWFDDRGTAHLVDEMPAAARHDLRRRLWLERRPLWVGDCITTLAVERVSDLHAVVSASQRGVLPHQLGPDRWHDSRPLMQRLGQLVGDVPDRLTDGQAGDETGPRAATLEHADQLLMLLTVGMPLTLDLAARGAAVDDLRALVGSITGMVEAVTATLT